MWVFAPLCFWLFVGLVLADFGPPEPKPKTPILDGCLILGALALMLLWVGSFIV